MREIRHAEQIHGNLHLANKYLDLGSELCSIKKYKKASKAYRIAEEIRKGVFGSDHLLVSEAKRARGLALWKLGRREKAIETLSVVLERLEHQLGGDHGDVAQVLRCLAVLHCSCNKRACGPDCPRGCEPSASLSYLLRLLDIQRRSLVDASEVRDTMEFIASMHTFMAHRYAKCGEHDLAIGSYEEALCVYIELEKPADALVAYLALSVLNGRRE